MSKKICLLLVFNLILFANIASGQPTLNAYCNYIASISGRFGVQYQPDISAQRCSFCQLFEYTSSQNTQNPYTGCLTCPDYQTGQCKVCKPNYFSTPNQVCVPCPEGNASCCSTNLANDEPNLSTFTNTINLSTYADYSRYAIAVQFYSAIRAISCLPGYVQLGHVCQKYPDNCQTVSVQSNSFYCSACKAGYFFDNNNSCVNNGVSIRYIYNTVPFPENFVKCSGYSSYSTCTGCQSQQGQDLVIRYFTLDSSSIKIEQLTDSTGQTSKTYQVCRECPQYCINCDGNYQQCKVCAPYYFLQNGNCKPCPTPDQYIQLNSDLQLQAYYSGCTSGDSSYGSYTWNTSIPQNMQDTLGLAISRPIIKLSSGKYTACDVNCVSCQSDQNGKSTICNACANGFFLDKSQSPYVCSVCPDPNSVLCVWNDTIKMAQIIACKATANDFVPYHNTYYLQLDFNLNNFNQNPSTYDNKNQCVLNTKNCKQMINNRLGVQGQCSSCYQSSDLARVYQPNAGYQPLNYYLTSQNSCVTCLTPNSSDCALSSDKTQVVVTKCKAGYQPTPISDGTCKQCPSKCLTCNDQSQCTSCDTSKYYSITTQGQITDCQPAYAPNTAALEGCLNWGSGPSMPSTPSCQTCNAGYVLVSDAQLQTKTSTQTVALCLACPSNCTQCYAGQQRAICSKCSIDTYLSNNVCISLPDGCFTVKNGACTQCQYGYRLVDNKFCFKCVSSNSASDLQNRFFYDCPGAQCAAVPTSDQSEDSLSTKTTQPSSSFQNKLQISILCLLLLLVLLF
ncbi:zinc finger, LSD1 subclass family protein, putative (macronuclear) [Tetrahymena thermophila SB210]|uniref:Zinc finger, LSD1 subclass family protein, putative n=1 Tax=Tetrahymena thermophila (strain SB210) TaxID=312017 RepID=Q23QC2_TETTS|nr:zinc finger, LSD1 subclass family protein, putative [Tetrahymena thermophila SB210]EAR98662.1 zinc finger, LSD1 subclass family protein, putative [Tetrahymena thermophila SB210]|eukprot:XP_001018907.1 zinc finger, LSD1 subclass family protein, putative [Tetrahymena thermophila SB210]